MTGRTYLLHGEPVVVVARWTGPTCPRNVLIRHGDGRLMVRPFRGLRKPALDAFTGGCAASEGVASEGVS